MFIRFFVIIQFVVFFLPVNAHGFMVLDAYESENNLFTKVSDVKDLYNKPYIYKKNKDKSSSSRNLLINKGSKSSSKQKAKNKSYSMYRKPYTSPNSKTELSRQDKELLKRSYSSLTNDEKRDYQRVQTNKINQENEKKAAKEKASKERKARAATRNKNKYKANGKKKKKYIWKKRTIKYRKQYDFDVNDVAPRSIRRD